MDLIAGHQNLDFDAFASMLACRRLYPGATIALHGSLNRNVRDFVRLHTDELELADGRRIEPTRVRRLVLVEVSEPSRLGELQSLLELPTVELVLFDHHRETAPAWLRGGEAVLSQDGALTTTLVSILAERGIDVSPLEATVLALGIHEDTGSLTYPSVTARDVEALAWCFGHGARQEMIAQYLHLPLSPEERALFEALVAAVEPVTVRGTEVLVAAISWPAYVDGVSGLAQKVAELTESRTLVCLVEMEGRVVAVIRSRDPGFDAAVVAGSLGGGGHAEASAATFHGPLEEARRIALEALERAVPKWPTAAEIMARPARFVTPDDTVAHAMSLCQRHRQSGIQVGDPGTLLGVVSREDLDKAIAHGLENAPVKAVMGPGHVTCDVDTPLPTVQRLLLAAPAGRVPVLEGGRVVGVVTRANVLRALGEPSQPREETGEVVADLLLRLPGLEPVFEAIQAVSEPFDGVYLVGGAVRDLLLGEQSFDLDIAVEGDGVALARSLARVLHGRAVPHEKFGTAVVVFPGGRIDVATTRTELYDYPAALPTVERATIAQDLHRRDFTINAMAVSLRGPDFGRLVDPFGGRRDLDRGILRVLHNLSFIDDPTRMFRAIRYESRYRFRMDGHTAHLAHACVEMGLVGELSSARLRDELQALLSEERAGPSVLRLAELGLAQAINAHLSADEEAARLVDEIETLRARYAPREPRWRPRLAVLAHRIHPDELYEWFGRLRLRRRDADAIADAVAVAPRLPHLLEKVTAPSEARRLLAPHDPLGLLLALARFPGTTTAAWIIRYLTELKAVKLEITGVDLAALGLHESPRVGEVLEELLQRKLDGDLPGGREAELAAAREAVVRAVETPA